ncbi:GTP-binding protein [Nodosilinea sp. E11]|uniref:GTP-binding protein n=1 Tax=Nodosilinea sp. E11 TaxID=3037479 RepID=UPI0029350E23|nr:ATP/GTP-binding protein [Nodosilinea sp. E11]WOD38135.1 ATP/GTP-binding protein [Nodosilinea sp. E11]
MEVLRLVVTGPVGAGKSTFVRSISEIKVVDTDRKATDETAQLKQKTTVALDFGRLKFSKDMVLHIYGTPGQTRFNFMWDLLIHKADAYILLVPANRPAELRNARVISNFMQQRTQAPMIVGFTHMDCPGAWGAKDIAIAMGYGRVDIKRPPIIRVDPTNKSSVAQATIKLVEQFSQNLMLKR